MSRKKKLSTAQVIKDAAEIFHGIRWKLGIVVCPYCGSMHIKVYDGYRYKCNSCKNRFSDRTKTLMHGSKLPISVWMQAIYEMSVDNFISSNVLATKLGINQKSAWLLRMKIDYSLPQDRYMLQGVVAQDEMYLGGCLSNYHYSRKWDLLRKGHYLRGDEKRYTKEALFSLNSDLKQPVFGMNDGDKIVLIALPNKKKKEYLWKLGRKYVKRGSVTVSDESKLYDEWERHTGRKLYTNNHHNNQYITYNGLTSNRIENTFSWYKRGFGARITHCKYHQFYLNEFVFRYNNRFLSTEDMFKELVSSTIGKHVTYQEIRKYIPYTEVLSKAEMLRIEKKEKQRLKTLKWILDNTFAESIESHHRIYRKGDL